MVNNTRLQRAGLRGEEGVCIGRGWSQGGGGVRSSAAAVEVTAEPGLRSRRGHGSFLLVFRPSFLNWVYP